MRETIMRKYWAVILLVIFCPISILGRFDGKNRIPFDNDHSIYYKETAVFEPNYDYKTKAISIYENVEVAEPKNTGKNTFCPMLKNKFYLEIGHTAGWLREDNGRIFYSQVKDITKGSDPTLLNEVFDLFDDKKPEIHIYNHDNGIILAEKLYRILIDEEEWNELFPESEEYIPPSTKTILLENKGILRLQAVYIFEMKKRWWWQKLWHRRKNREIANETFLPNDNTQQ